MRKIFILLAVLFLLLPLSGEIGYPTPKDDYVNDYADVLSQADADAIHKMFEDLEHQTGIEAVVITIDSMDNYDTEDSTIEEFSTHLFNRWGIGHKRDNNGVLILVAVKDRKCRIELGQGYGRRYDSVMKQVIDEKMIPHFKTDEYSRGIYEGSQAVVLKITKKVSWFSFYKWHLLLGVLIIVCIFAGFSMMKSGKTGWGWAFFAAAGVLLFFLIRMLARGKGSSGFGGGSSFGGGASGSW
ncbi:TPM domain-containing protein [bacterium]|nr:TPM domain-containing protein [bacterium]